MSANELFRFGGPVRTWLLRWRPGRKRAIAAGLFALTLTAVAAYRIENVALPESFQGGVSAVAFTPQGSLVIATRYGEVWRREPTTLSWRRFARGLNEPLGLVAESETVMYVAHRPELLRLEDTDADGAADWFRVINGDWGQSHNYHEFFFGLRRDSAGNFYGALSLNSTADKVPIDPAFTRGKRDARWVLEPSYHGSEMQYRGWAVKITPEGKLIPLASGLRQPNGVGLSPEGELFTNDNQGDYKPSCGLLHIAEGDFHGHVESVKWERGFEAGALTTEKLWRRYKSPAVVFPHGVMGVSGGEPVWDLTAGKFGPFERQVFVGDYNALILRAELEKVAGGWQGAAFPFLGRNDAPTVTTGEKLNQGTSRMAFAPDGSLYLAQTAGWGGGGDGLQRVSWDGRVAPEILSMKLTERGFALRFTHAMDLATLAKPESYAFTRFRYYYQIEYGSPWIDETQPDVREVRVAPDGRGVEVLLPELEPGYVFQLSVPTLRTASGEPLANPLAFYTANRLPDGRVAVGGTTRLPRPGETAIAASAANAEAAKTTGGVLAIGEKIYTFYCVACHQPDGRGVQGGAANFVDDKARLAKTDEALMKVIAEGNELKGMPAFKAMLRQPEMRAVLTYIRARFGDNRPTESKAPE